MNVQILLIPVTKRNLLGRQNFHKKFFNQNLG